LRDAATVALDRDPQVGPDPTWEALDSPARQQWLEDINDFPPPALLIELLSGALNFSSYDPQRLAEKISHDAVLTGRLISRVNSAAFGLRTPVTNLRQTIVHLGFNLVRSTIMRYQVESSAATLSGLVREQLLTIQQSTDNSAVIGFNWAKAIGLPDAGTVGTLCQLARLGSFLIARRFAEQMEDYFAAGHEPQRMNYEANHFGVTTRTLTYKVAQAWALPEGMRTQLFNVWTPLFAPVDDPVLVIACAGTALGFDPPNHMDDIQKWLALRVHIRLTQNLERIGALGRLPDLLDSDVYRREMATVAVV
jgi:HD-like signal output (HDOD) protein